MNLVIDIGNSNSKLGYFKNKSLIHHKVIKGRLEPGFVKRELSRNENIHRILISSVVNEIPDVQGMTGNEINLLILDEVTPLPINLDYHTPHTLGNDRIAAATAAHNIFPDDNVLVIDAGSCITYDLVNYKGVYQGGAISPGIAMRYKALNDNTDKLPLLNPIHLSSFPFIGKSTEECIISGVQNGCLMEINGFIEKSNQKYPGIKVVLCGGYTEYLAENVKYPIFADSNLVLKGLNQILEFNMNEAPARISSN